MTKAFSKPRFFRRLSHSCASLRSFNRSNPKFSLLARSQKSNVTQISSSNGTTTEYHKKATMLNSILNLRYEIIVANKNCAFLRRLIVISTINFQKNLSIPSTNHSAVVSWSAARFENSNILRFKVSLSKFSQAGPRTLLSPLRGADKEIACSKSIKPHLFHILMTNSSRRFAKECLHD